MARKILRLPRISLIGLRTTGPRSSWNTNEAAVIGPTLAGLAINMTCVMADGGRIGLYAGNSLPDGGWSFTFIVWKHTQTDCLHFTKGRSGKGTFLPSRGWFNYRTGTSHDDGRAPAVAKWRFRSLAKSAWCVQVPVSQKSRGLFLKRPEGSLTFRLDTMIAHPSERRTKYLLIT